MIKRGRGRPPKVDSERKRITIDEAVKISHEFWSQFNKSGYSKGYIYNLVSASKLQKEKHGKCVLLFEDEVRQKLCG